MWCRVLLVAIAVTCTFQREILAQPDGHSTQRIDRIKDVICVLLLSGLQKEDLDVSVLQKLKRHNVNIDDMYNEPNRKECGLIANPITITNNTSPPTEETLTITNAMYEQTSQTNSTGFENIFGNTKMKWPDVENNQRNKNMAEIIHSTQTDIGLLPGGVDFEKYIRLWRLLELSKGQDEVDRLKSTTPCFTESTTMMKQKTKDAIDMDYINKMLQSYIAAQKLQTKTPQPTTTAKIINPLLQKDIVSQKLRELLENVHYNAFTEPQLETATIKTVKSYIETLSNEDIADFLRIKGLLRKSTYFNEPKVTPQNFAPDRNLSNEKNEIPNDVKPSKADLSTLPDDIIKEIAEKVKESVLKDLKTQITTTIRAATTTVPTTGMTTTVDTTTTTPITLPPTTNSQKVKDVNSVLQNILELFQQLKLVKDGEMTHDAQNGLKLAQIKETKNEFHGPVNVLYPPMVPPNAYGIQNETSNAIASKVPILSNPYHQVSIINKPVQQKMPQQTEETNQVFNSLHDSSINTLNGKPKAVVQMEPLTIQTYAGAIPPIGIPVPNTIKAVNQNIVVTTKHPMVQLKEDQQTRYNTEFLNKHLDYAATASPQFPETYLPKTKYSSESERNYRQNRLFHPRERHVVLQKSDRIDRESKVVPRLRQHSEEYYKELIKNMQQRSARTHLASPSHQRNRGRYHEILEGPEKWQGMFRQKENDSKPDKRLKVASRQQMSINSMKKKSRYDDAHFRNFLKTQKKVNEMLERILATKNLDVKQSDAEAF